MPYLETLTGAAAAICTTVSYIPQLKKAWVSGETGDLSLKMLLLLGAGLALWTAYGVMRADAVIIAANGISLTLLSVIIYLKVRMSTASPMASRPHSDGLIDGFERRRLLGDGVEIDALVGGGGPPLLLLHGYPQTRVMWKAVAPALAQKFTVVVPDLRGYGRSDKPEGDAAHVLYSKRAMALDQIATMRALGFDRFAIAGHDRGARVGYRLALDWPDVVSALGVLDILPTAEVWAGADAESAMKMYHWYFLAQPRPLPETLIGGDPAFFLRYTLESWAGRGFQFDAASMADYVACFCDPAAIHATCEDYRAGWSVDRAHDEADRGKKLIKAPLLVVWSEGYSVAKATPLKRWGEWAERIEGHSVPGGHFVCEEQPEKVRDSLLRFFVKHAGA